MSVVGVALCAFVTRFPPLRDPETGLRECALSGPVHLQLCRRDGRQAGRTAGGADGSGWACGLRVVSSFSLSQTPPVTSPAFRVRGHLQPVSEAGQPSGRLGSAEVLSAALCRFAVPPAAGSVAPGGPTSSPAL